MKTIIKTIRERLGITQQQFASELSTTVVSINRWENGKTIPNRMAQGNLLEFCRRHNVDVSDVIADKYRCNNKDFILYHGSKKGIKGNISPASSTNCDFGSGFYMGVDILPPLTLICGEAKPKLYAVDLDFNGLNVLNLGLGIEWVMLIAYHRGYMESVKGSLIYEKYKHYFVGYDLVVGHIANDRLYTELNKFFKGDITDEVLLHCLSALDLGKQYVAITQKACKNINIIKEDVISNLELKILQEKAYECRKKGNVLAKKIEKQYRREGKYFDEILVGE